MTELLVIVGVIVFFISVLGAVMIGGHLLDQAAKAGERATVRLRPAGRDESAALADTSSERAADGLAFPQPVAAG